MILQYIQHYLHTRIKQVAGCAQCASIGFLTSCISFRQGVGEWCLVTELCITCYFSCALGSGECWYGSSLDGGGSGLAFLHSSVCWKWGRFYEWSRMISNALVVIHIYALWQTRIYARIYIYTKTVKRKPVMGAQTCETLTGLQGCHGYLEIRHPVF